MLAGAFLLLTPYTCPLSYCHWITPRLANSQRNGIAEVMPRGYGGFTSALLPLISAYFRMFLMLLIMLLPQFFIVFAFTSAVF